MPEKGMFCPNLGDACMDKCHQIGANSETKCVETMLNEPSMKVLRRMSSMKLQQVRISGRFKGAVLQSRHRGGRQVIISKINNQQSTMSKRVTLCVCVIHFKGTCIALRGPVQDEVPFELIPKHRQLKKFFTLEVKNFLSSPL